MKLRWLWRLCPCQECGLRRHPPADNHQRHLDLHAEFVRRHLPNPAINMPKLMAMLLEEGFDIRDTDELLRKDIAETLGVVNNRRFQIPLPDAFAERKAYSYGVFVP